jgi:uncharacterized membrane protein YdjX (TVP38/TMEM64 family)
MVFIALVVIAICVLLFTDAREFFQKERLLKVAQDLGWYGPLIIVGISLVAPLLFLPRAPVAFVSGFLYGIAWGTLLANVASTFGAILNFWLARNLLSPMSDRLRARRAATAQEIKPRHAFWALIFLRAFPFSNFVATNLMAGALKIPFRTYIMATFIGMIPSSIMYAAWGKFAKEPNASFGAVAAGTVVFIVVGTILAKKYLMPWLRSLGLSQPD